MLTRRICCHVCVAAMLIPVAAHVSAQTADRRAIFTFKTPVEVPGIALPPGQYMFRVVDPDTGGKVVQVLSGDGKKVYATFFSIPALRLEPPDASEIRFAETPAGVPPMAKTWWYPGDTIGKEFIYPRTQALRLAKKASEPILTTRRDSSTADQTNTSDLSRVSANGQETQESAESKPVAAAPRGMAQQAEKAKTQ
jgi:hypothetical protein